MPNSHHSPPGDYPLGDYNPNITFRAAYCKVHQCPSSKFEKRLFAQTLFFHTRLLDLFCRIIHPDGFHAERALISQAGDKILLNDIQLDIDFYQHKNVVGSLFRESFKFRLSGKRLLKIAKLTFQAYHGQFAKVSKPS